MGSLDSQVGLPDSSSDIVEGQAAGPLETVRLDLIVSDPECVEALGALPEGRTRQEYARQALRIGILALKQAQGRLDADALRNEGERLIGALSTTLADYRQQTETLLAGTLRQYFDPNDGRFTERVERLVKHDGELERLMRSQIETNQRAVTEVLTEFVGQDSALLRLLTPDESNLFLGGLRKSVQEVLTGQSTQILREFSLDNTDSALSRLVRELKERHGELTEDLAKQIGGVVNEFSLDDENSALSRLVRRVEQAQTQISAEFSLDAEQSALARLRRELLSVLNEHREQNEKFQAEVQTALGAMRVRKEEAARSTVHGREFEQAGFAFVQDQCQRAGDVAEDVGATTGLIPRSKVGDSVITLGVDCAAAGARIVLEFKEQAGYTLKKTLEEIDEARKNRVAQIGLFVHSAKTMPVGLPPLARHGSDVVVAWDADKEESDVILLAGLMVAKALCVRAKAAEAAHSADLSDMEKAVREIERQASKFDDIRTKCGTIKSGADAILAVVDTAQRGMLKQVVELDEHLSHLKAQALGEDA